MLEQYYTRQDADIRAHRAFNRGAWLGALSTFIIILAVDLFIF